MAENKNKLEELNDEQLDNVAGGFGGYDGGLTQEDTGDHDNLNPLGNI